MKAHTVSRDFQVLTELGSLLLYGILAMEYFIKTNLTGNQTLVTGRYP
jgi:hypothetical protein